MSSFAWRQKLILFVCSWEVIIQIFLWYLLIILKENLLFSSIGFLYSSVSSGRQVETSDFPSVTNRGFMSAHQIKTFLTAEGNGWYCLGHSNIEMKSIALCNLFHYIKARDRRTSSPNFNTALGLTRNTKDLLQYQVRGDLLRGTPFPWDEN